MTPPRRTGSRRGVSKRRGMPSPPRPPQSSPRRGRAAPPPNRTDPRIVALLGTLAAVLIGVVFVFANPFGGTTASPSPSLAAAASRSTTGCPTSQPAALASTDTRTVTIHTTKGAIVIKVEGALAPIAAGNFVALANCGFYNGLVFHRVVSGFVIQGGDPKGDGTGGPGYEFPDETVTGEYTRGTVAMANSGANTNGSQFFICVADDTTLPKSYTIFGHVTSGMDVADAIVAAANGVEIPPNPIAMTSVTVANP